MRRREQKRLLQLLALGVWSLLIVFLAAEQRFGAKSGVLVRLVSEPAAVKILLDGRPLFDGRYVQTPVNLQMAKGKHILKLSRQGYEPHRVVLDADLGDSFDLPKIELEKQLGERFIDLDLVLAEESASAAVVASIGDGLVRGRLPFQATDLVAGEAYDIDFFLVGKEKRPLYRCRFKAPQPGSEANGKELVEPKALIAITYQNTGAFKAEGCRRLKKNTSD